MSHEHQQIGAAAARLADRLPQSLMVCVAEAVAQHGSLDPAAARRAILHCVPTPDFRDALGCLLGEDWTTPRLVEMVITPDGHMLGRPAGEPSFKAFLGASEDLIKNVHGVAPIAELDGDEIGYLVGKVAEIKRQR